MQGRTSSACSVTGKGNLPLRTNYRRIRRVVIGVREFAQCSSHKDQENTTRKYNTKQLRCRCKPVKAREGDLGTDDETSYASYEATSPAYTVLVDALTRVVNFFGLNQNEESIENDKTKASPITEEQLLEGLRKDFVENQYLWTGKITPDLYCSYCTFTDPTLSFQGLKTFQKNLENLDPLIEKCVRDDRLVELRSIKVVDDCDKPHILARWRMFGTINLPWKPTLDLCGQTKFFYHKEEKRVVRYYEQWEDTVGEAFKQLLFPK